MFSRTPLILLLAIACGGAGSDKTAEICGNEVDDDGNGLTDCADEACADPACPEVCDDGVDNNLDELTDCDDAACTAACAGEVCGDGLDNDGNSLIDCEDPGCAAECDLDGDGHFDLFDGGGDCNDFNPDVYPGAPEVCDGYDNDCDGLVDRLDPDVDQSTMTDWSFDEDGDGYGDPARRRTDCFAPMAGMVDNADDCHDGDPDRNPGMTEVCNDIDDNCDGLTDDADPLLDTTTALSWFADSDGDGLGDAATIVLACREPIDAVDNDMDCDDTDPLTLGPSMWLLDGDGDGFGAGAATGVYGCTPPGPGYVPDNRALDCDDADPIIYPGAYEPCGDGLDFDCDTRDCAEWGDDFESGTISADWTLTGNANWFAQSTTVYGGSFAAECGNIADNQVSTMSVTVDFPVGGEVSFWHTGSTENGWDYLEFTMDGILQDQWSGTWGWTNEIYPVGPGVHTLTWEYDKDGSVSTGADTVWVDEILMPGGSL